MSLIHFKCSVESAKNNIYPELISDDMVREKSPEDLDVSEEDLSGPEIDRRTVVKLLGASSIAGSSLLAGCTGNGDGSGGGDGGNSDSSDGSDGESESTSEPDSEETPTSTTGDGRGGTLTVGWNGNEITKIYPLRNSNTASIQILGNIFGGLLEIREDLTLQGDVAADWTVEDGGETITFDLVENATFHNGNACTAEDIKYSIGQALDDGNPNIDRLAALQPIDDGGVVVEDDYTVTLNFEEPFAPILLYLTPDIGGQGAIVSQDALEEMGESQFEITPVSVGPFKVVEHELGSTMITEAHEDYHRTDSDGNPLPYLDELHFEPIKEGATRINAIRTGDVDSLNAVPNASTGQLEDSDSVTVSTRLGPNFGGLAFNHNVEPFGNRTARRAVAKAIDEERYVEEALLGNGMADTGVYSPVQGWVYRDEFGDANDQKPPDQRYAPEEARELAEEAGIMGLEIEMMVSQPERRGAQVLQTILSEELDWDVTLDIGDFSTVFSRLKQGDYNLIPWGNSAAPDPDQLVTLFGDAPGNYWGYEDEEIQELIQQQRTTLDREERKELLWDIEDRVLQEAPWVLFEHQQIVTANRTSVQNYTNFGLIMRYREVSMSE
jgi:peptide/nickel transport system substrate-binding protein